MWKKGSKRYIVIWESEKQYRDFNSLFIAKLIWLLNTNANHILDSQKKIAIYTKRN